MRVQQAFPACILASIPAAVGSGLQARAAGGTVKALGIFRRRGGKMASECKAIAIAREGGEFLKFVRRGPGRVREARGKGRNPQRTIVRYFGSMHPACD